MYVVNKIYSQGIFFLISFIIFSRNENCCRVLTFYGVQLLHLFWMLIFILDGMIKGWKEVNWHSNIIIIAYIRLIVVNYIGTSTLVIILVSQIYLLQLHALHPSCNYLHGLQNNLAILALALFRLLILFFSKLWFKHSYSLLPGSKTNRRAKGSRQFISYVRWEKWLSVSAFYKCILLST